MNRALPPLQEPLLSDAHLVRQIRSPWNPVGQGIVSSPDWECSLVGGRHYLDALRLVVQMPHTGCRGMLPGFVVL